MSVVSTAGSLRHRSVPTLHEYNRAVQFSLAAGAVTLAAILLLALSGPAYQLGVSLAVAFTLLRWSAYLALLGVALATAATVFALRRDRRKAAALGIAVLAVSAVSFGIPNLWQQRARSAPPIHDITTDLENPPTFDAIVPLRAGAPNNLERPPDLALQQRRAYGDLQPITLAVPPAEAFEAALALARRRGWEIVEADAASGRIEATDTTRWFGFKDDVVIRLTPWGTGTRVDMRSVSRIGIGDAGTNARRIQRFLEELAER